MYIGCKFTFVYKFLNIHPYTFAYGLVSVLHHLTEVVCTCKLPRHWNCADVEVVLPNAVFIFFNVK